MSEYQYYEFAAVERPLKPKEIAALRRVSTRAVITPSGFVNHYEWGGLKADPSDWMRRYFDAFLWVSSCGAGELMLRVPAAMFDDAELKRCLTRPAFTCANFKDHCVLRWSLAESDDYERFVEDDGRGWMGRLLRLRDELLRGDRRPLYLGWLAGVTTGEVADRAHEPELPSGLSQLTPAQHALVEFLEIDVDLLAAAASESPKLPSSDSAEAEAITAWLEQLPATELRTAAAFVLQGQAHEAERQMRSQFLAWRKRLVTPAANIAKPRSVASLRAAAKGEEQARLIRQAKARERQEAAERQRREAYLRRLAANAETAWSAIEQLAERGTGQGYDAAQKALAELSEACTLASRGTEFHHELRHFVIRHERRKALIQRLVRVGLFRECVGIPPSARVPTTEGKD